MHLFDYYYYYGRDRGRDWCCVATDDDDDDGIWRQLRLTATTFPLHRIKYRKSQNYYLYVKCFNETRLKLYLHQINTTKNEMTKKIRMDLNSRWKELNQFMMRRWTHNLWPQHRWKQSRINWFLTLYNLWCSMCLTETTKYDPIFVICCRSN